MICCVITSIVAKLCRMHSLTEAWRGHVTAAPRSRPPAGPLPAELPGGSWGRGRPGVRGGGHVGAGPAERGEQRGQAMHVPARSVLFHPGQHSRSTWTRWDWPVATGPLRLRRCGRRGLTDKTFSVPCHGCHPSEFKAKTS